MCIWSIIYSGLIYACACSNTCINIYESYISSGNWLYFRHAWHARDIQNLTQVDLVVGLRMYTFLKFYSTVSNAVFSFLIQVTIIDKFQIVNWCLLYTFGFFFHSWSNKTEAILRARSPWICTDWLRLPYRLKFTWHLSHTHVW